jgi:tetratricopeptide (TPR) repeat protein
LAAAAQLHGDLAAAVEHYQAVLDGRDAAYLPRAANNLAWLYATESDAQIRNGSQAVQLAELACRLTRRKNPAYLGTLGSAYAEAGRFAEAVDVTRLALELADTRDAEALRASLQARLQLYENQQPYHQPPRRP